MKTVLGRFNNLNIASVDTINEEITFLQNTLEVLRVTNKISNDAFLDAGIIQGGLSLISNLLSQGVSSEEANTQLRRLKDKEDMLTKTYPELDNMIESMR
jgi:hypothetical protein